MAGIGGIGGMPGVGGANPLSGLAGSGMGGQLSGLGDMGIGGGDQGGGAAPGGGMGMQPTQPASAAQGASFGDALKATIIDNPSKTKAESSALLARMVSGDKSVDPHTLSIASAKAGVEIQMSTRTISSAVSAVRTLFQMQV